MSEQLTPQEWSIAVNTAEAAGLKFGVDSEEVLGYVGVWIAESWDLVFSWRDQEKGLAQYRGAVRHKATDAARELMLAERGVDAESSHLYSQGELRRLLVHALDEQWYRKPVAGQQDGPGGTVDPRTVNNWQDTMMDVRDAFFSLNRHGQETVQHGLAVLFDWDKLGVRFGVTPEAARERIKYQLDKMREFLGGPEARIHGEWVGTKNMPEYNDYAASVERRQTEEWLYG